MDKFQQALQKLDLTGTLVLMSYLGNRALYLQTKDKELKDTLSPKVDSKVLSVRKKLII